MKHFWKYLELDGFKFRVGAGGKILNAKDQELNQNKDRSGYLRIWTTLPSGKRKSYSVHRLVSIAYIPNKSNKPCVNHKDGNKQNNDYKNLEWCTHKENTAHAFSTGLMDNALIKRTKMLRNHVIKFLVKSGYSKSDLALIFQCGYANINRVLKNTK